MQGAASTLPKLGLELTGPPPTLSSTHSSGGKMAHHREYYGPPLPPPPRLPHLNEHYWPTLYPSSSLFSMSATSRPPLLPYPMAPAPLIAYPPLLYPPPHSRLQGYSYISHHHSPNPEEVVSERHHKHQLDTSDTTSSHSSSVPCHSPKRDSHSRPSKHWGSHARMVDPPQRPTVHINRSLMSPTGSRYPTVSLLCYTLLAQDLVKKNMHL